MRVICEKEKILKGISSVINGVASKTTMPILEGILIQTNDNELKLTSYDLEIGIETYAQAEVIEEGQIVINSRLFGDIIRKLPDAFVEIETDNENNVYINCLNSRFTEEYDKANCFCYISRPNKTYING